MTQLILQRGLFSICVLLVVSFIIFMLTHLVPGSPALMVLGADVRPDQLLRWEQQHGLDRPLLIQYADWLWRIVSQFDFGMSFISGKPITQEIAATLPITLEIVTVAFLFCILLSIPLGIVSAIYENRAIDHAARVFAVVGVSVPGFWLGLMLIVYLSVGLRLFPPGGFVPLSQGLGRHLNSIALPAFSLGIYYTAIISRMMRSSMIDVSRQDYVRTAVAMGLGRGRVLIYAIKNALIPVVSVGAMSIGYMFGWAIIIEQVFNISGISRLLVTSIFQRDYNMVQAVVLVITSIFILSNFGADVLYRLLNPKVAQEAS